MLDTKTEHLLVDTRLPVELDICQLPPQPYSILLKISQWLQIKIFFYKKLKAAIYQQLVCHGVSVHLKLFSLLLLLFPFTDLYEYIM